MKKIVLLAGVAAMAFTACQKESKFTLTAENLPADLNGTYFYISEQSSKTPIDSVAIADGKFVYTSTVDSTAAYVGTLGEARFLLIKEAGNLTLAADSTRQPATYKVSGAQLNDAYYAYKAELAAMTEPVQAEFQAIANDATLLPEVQAAKQDSIFNAYTAATDVITKALYEANKNNALGALAFGNINYSDEEFITAYEGASDVVKNNSALTKRYNTLQNAAKTQVGADFVDFDITDAAGNVTKFSSFIGNGKYLLVDVWASWCGPCRRAMPHLAELHANFAEKGLRILSVGVWEKNAEDNTKAIAELNMTWETIFDSKDAIAEVYGVSGVPTLLLFSPEGKILVRTHTPEDIDAALAEAFAATK